MIVTINTDASFHQQKQRGSFAFWIVCNEFKITRSGILRKKCHRPEQAEFRCIINALHVLLTQDLKNVKKIIVNTDCLNVIHLLTKNKNAITRYRLGSWGNNLVLRFEMMLGQLNRKIEVEYRHIKSHEHTDTAKNWVNDWCDKNAKKALWGALNKY
jgi:ribonuclease HI